MAKRIIFTYAILNSQVSSSVYQHPAVNACCFQLTLPQETCREVYCGWDSVAVKTEVRIIANTHLTQNMRISPVNTDMRIHYRTYTRTCDVHQVVLFERKNNSTVPVVCLSGYVFDVAANHGHPSPKPQIYQYFFVDYSTKQCTMRIPLPFREWPRIVISRVVHSLKRFKKIFAGNVLQSALAHHNIWFQTSSVWLQ